MYSRMKLLLALLDTEGGMMREGLRVPLREVCALVLGAGTLRTDPRGNERFVLHGNTWERPSLLLWAGESGDAFKRDMLTAMRRLCVEEDAEGFAFVAWNAAYDRAIMRQNSGDLAPLQTRWACGMRWTKETLPDLDKYSLAHVMKELGVERHQKHRAYTDVLDMWEVIQAAGDRAHTKFDPRRFAKGLKWSRPESVGEEVSADIVPVPFKARTFEYLRDGDETYAVPTGWHEHALSDFKGFGVRHLKNNKWQTLRTDKKAELLHEFCRSLYPWRYQLTSSSPEPERS